MSVEEAERLLWERTHDTEQVTCAMRAGVRRAILDHKLKRIPLVVWRDNQVVHIPPEEIVVPKPAKRKREK